MEFKTSLELLSDVAEKHLEDDKAMNFQFHNTPKSDGEGKHTSVAFSESLLDDFLLAGYQGSKVRANIQEWKQNEITHCVNDCR